VIEADYNGARERDGERAPYYRLFYQMTRMARAKGALAQDDRIDALAGAVAFWTRHLARDTNKAVLDHKEAMFNKEAGEVHAPRPGEQGSTAEAVGILSSGNVHRRGVN